MSRMDAVSSHLKTIVIFLLLLGISLCFGLMFLKSLHCGDFSVQIDAQFFYDIGAHQLDGNDHDGRACESLLHARAGTVYL